MPVTGGPVLVGRERERAELGTALDAAAGGRGTVQALVGPPGIGKTVLAQAVVAEALAAGWRTGWGRCLTDAGAPAYWPWRQALGGVDREAAALLEAGRPGAETLDSPELPAEPASARLGLFARLSQRLRELAADRPILLVLDDLHASDVASLSLLRFFCAEVLTMPGLVLSTWRESERLGAVAHEVAVIPLRGLSEPEAAELTRHHLGRRPPVSLVRRIHRLSEGNPLFIAAVARQRAAEEHAGMVAPDASAVRLPATVAEAIARQLEPLSVASADTLATAALLGREVDPGLVAEVAEGAESSLSATVADLEQAAGAGLLERADQGGYRFVHGLIRDVALERLSPARRAALHARAVQALGARSADAATLAHHLRGAGPEAHEAAIEWSLKAARHALDVLAYEEAAAQAGEALALPVAGRRRIELLLLLGDARTAAGEIEAGRAALVQAGHEAQKLGDARLVVAAALGLGRGTPAWAGPGGDPEFVALAAHALTGPVPPVQRACLLARLAEDEAAARRFQDAEARSAEAVAQARHSGDDVALTRALTARLLATLPAAEPAGRQVLVRELAASAMRSDDMDVQFDACLWSLHGGLEAGERAAVLESRQRMQEIAERTRQPHQLWHVSVVSAMVALIDGRLADSEDLAQRALSEGQGVVALGPAIHAIQLIAVRREQGRLGELEPMLRQASAAQPAAVSWRLAWLGALSEQGADGLARTELRRLDAGVFAIDPADYEWPGRITLLAELCARLGELDRAEILYKALAPHAEQVAVASLSALCRGSVDHYLGLLAGALGRRADAERHFDAAQALHERLGSPLWIARTEADRAAMRAACADSAAARRAADKALEVADVLGLAAIAARAREALAGPLPASGADILIFSREGELWAIGDPAAAVRVKDARGLGYIARLLCAPGQELLAAELAGATASGDDAVLDEEAKAAYRTRIEELRERAASAARFGDAAAARRADAELEALAAELRRAVGLRGRDRHLAGPAQRARSSVTKAIRSAIRRLADADPALAQHLDSAIRTGTFCRYVPDARHPIDWRVTM